MNRAIPRLILLVALAALLAGLTRFALLRFQSGDLYPAYSTLRADPVGAKAIFESLRRLEAEKVQRNLDRLELLKHGPGSTTIFLGANSGQLAEEENSLLQLARDGGRVIVAIDARDSRTTNWARFGAAPPAPKKGTVATNITMKVRGNRLLDLDIRPIDSKPDTNQLRAIREADIAGPESVSWFGRFCFARGTNDWETLYTLKDQPVVVSQKVGLGTLIVMADSFPFSNEAMHVGRETDFLLWAVAPGTVTFDETHLGIRRGSGVAVLMREFRLQGLAAGCLLLAGLWVWRNSAPFVPPAPAPAVAVGSVEGKTAREAIVYLLKRNLNDVDLLKSGVEEWAKAHPSAHYWQTVRLNEVRELVKRYAAMPKPRDLAAAQRQIAEILYPKQN